MVAHIAKAEIHCHIEGAVSPKLARQQARKYNENLSGFIVDGAYYWTNFSEFLAVYDKIAALFRTRDDYALLAETYLGELAEQGAVYSEFFISTDHASRTGLDPLEYIEGLADGIAAAKRRSGIEARMIATGLRHEGPEAVLRAARFIVDNPHPMVTGWGMAGDERMHRPSDFAAAFDLTRDAGLGITVHAGELSGAQSVADCLDHLRPTRIGHGVRAIEDSAVVERLAEEDIVLECCPGSNIALNVFSSYDDHPFTKLREAGVAVTLNSDDPPHFHTSLENEYEIARMHFGLDDDALMDITQTAISAAFVDENTRAELSNKAGPTNDD